MIWKVCIFLLCFLGGVDSRAEVPDSECLECHEDEELTDEAGRSMFVSPDTLAHSVHEGYACVECHTGVEKMPHEGKLPRVACRACHEEAQETYEQGAHGAAAKRGDPDAPGCADCHGTHNVRSVENPASMAYRWNLPETCARCHADPKVIRRHPFTVPAPVAAYRQSTHFRLLSKHNGEAPNCADCHGSHDLKPARDPASPIYWRNVPETCGKCHGEIAETYGGSVHGRAVVAGVRQAPVCTDCHGEHEIRGPKDPKSSVYPTHISKTTCVWCHESVRVVQKSGLAGRRLGTYLDSYHGLADRAGSRVVANCASCHGIHDIRPSADPKSSIHPSNLPETCGKCHPGVGQNVALGPVHVDPGVAEAGSLVLYYVRQFYILLILATVGGMLLHNGLDFARKFRAERLPDGDDYLRFTVSERVQHATMALSFIVLAYSGFALKFPQAWWAAPFAWLDGGEEGRRLVHRIAAVAMVAVCVFHIGYLAFTRRGRAQFWAMLPRLKDVRDFRGMLTYYFGRDGHHPAFDRFSYMEKVEYWALVWGSVVMTVTGFSLWMENLSLRFVPKWALDVATVIHYYEAWLAVLAILFWHFYWVIFNPKFYPMSLVWLTGRMSEEAMQEEHPLELEAIRKARIEGKGDGEKA